VAIKSDLSADRERGAGYGQLRIVGLGESSGPIDFSLMRNQGTQPYLGKGGIWQASETWHAADEVVVDGDVVVIPVGPDIVDAIVGQSANVAYRLAVAAGATKQVATLKVHGPLLGSGAAAPDDTAALEQQQREEEARRAREDEERRARETEDALRRTAAEEAARRATLAAAEDEARKRHEESALETEQTQQDSHQSTNRRRWPVIAALLALLVLIGGSGGAWFGCLIKGFGPPACNAELPASAELPVVDPPVEAELSCAGLTDGNACFEVAQRALEQKQLEPARQLLQQAASLGSVEANVFIARMYDPETWSTEASPVAAASWETAVYWYEKAARQGDGTGQLAAGKLLCQNALTEFEKNQGRSYLDQASKAGNAEAQTLLPGCQ
jgi:TPR repeat protein